MAPGEERFPLSCSANLSKEARAVRSGPEGTGDAAKRALAAARRDGYLATALRANAVAFEEDAPLFFRVSVQWSLGMWLNRDHGEHEVFAHEDASRKSRGQLTVTTVRRVGQVGTAGTGG